MISKKSVIKLRSLAQNVEAKYQIGKKEVGPEVIDLLDKALTANELIKIKILQSALANKKEIIDEVAERLKAEMIQTIGHTFVLYRESEDRIIKL